MASNAQILANQQNSQSSTGPRTEEGKQIASRNNFRHGLASNQLIVAGESLEEFEELHHQLIEEHQPTTITESILVKKMAQHYWLSQRAIRMQNNDDTNDQQFALYLRYQTTNDRAFSKSLSDLLKLRSERRKEQIGFESQNQAAALNESKIRALTAKSQAVELDSEIRQTIEPPLPGNLRIPFETLKHLFSTAVREVAQSA
jgi:hypothetical protein